MNQKENKDENCRKIYLSNDINNMLVLYTNLDVIQIDKNKQGSKVLIIIDNNVFNFSKKVMIQREVGIVFS